MIRLILVVIAFSGQLHAKDTVQLGWHITKEKPIRYAEWFGEVIPLENQIPKEKLEVRSFSDDLTKKLQSPQHQNPPQLTTLTYLDENTIRVKTVSLLANDKWSFKNGGKEKTRELLNRASGKIQLLADITPKGKLLSFYLKQKQKNAMAIQFLLPQQPVKIGDSWELPLFLIDVGSPLIPETAHRSNSVTLDRIAISDTGDRIAYLVYRAAEKIQGNVTLLSSNEPLPVAMHARLLGYGEFNIDRGRWEKLDHHLYIESSGPFPQSSATRSSLKFID